MKHYTIEIDELIMNFLKEKAEPFVDTPNTVLHKLLLKDSSFKKELDFNRPSFKATMPKALSQTLEVINTIVIEGKTRQEATKIVADRNNTAPQTIIDKYCRQLGKKAGEIDLLLSESGMAGFISILVDNFPKHKETIVGFFTSLQIGEEKMNHAIQQKELTRPQAQLQRLGTSTPDRKKRDTELESALKLSLGKKLQTQFGIFTRKGQSQLIFNKARVLSKFSSFHDDQSRWFWGVSKVYWKNWKPTDYLSLIMENEDSDGYSYILMDSAEAQDIFNECSESAGEKKINMRIYADDEIMRFQELKEFDVEGRLQPLEP